MPKAKIDYSPEGLFHPKKHKSFSAKAKRSMQKMYLIFVKQKNLMEKQIMEKLLK